MLFSFCFSHHCHQHHLGLAMWAVVSLGLGHEKVYMYSIFKAAYNLIKKKKSDLFAPIWDNSRAISVPQRSRGSAQAFVWLLHSPTSPSSQSGFLSFPLITEGTKLQAQNYWLRITLWGKVTNIIWSSLNKEYNQIRAFDLSRVLLYILGLRAKPIEVGWECDVATSRDGWRMGRQC